MPEAVEEKAQFSLFGHGLFGHPIEPPSRGPLADRFTVPPFSVLNAREGAWQERKRAWIGLGIKSELGRGQNTIGLSAQAEAYRNGEYEAEGSRPSSGLARCFGQDLMKGENPNFGAGHNGRRPHSGSLDERPGREPGTEYEGGDAWVASQNGRGTSIFDPVLCECAYLWFCPAGGRVLDPFAGGSVRGIVAACLGRHYYGIDLRPEQVAANRAQLAGIPAAAATAPEWACGDSLDLLPEAPAADLIFSCPPYGDLERYSDDPRELSTMEHHTFVATYKRIVMRACARLLPNRFACFVVGDFRDRKGHYRNFVSDTIAAFMEQGLAYYNEAILVTQVGSLPIRVGKQFAASRKLGRTHQQVLVFVKGDARKAAAACGDFDSVPARP